MAFIRSPGPVLGSNLTENISKNVDWDIYEVKLPGDYVQGENQEDMH